MAKYRHRIFEMYDFKEEAIDALTPKSTRVESIPSDPTPWTFQRLHVSLAKNTTHVQLTENEYSDENTENDLRDDFAQLADNLRNDSKVLLDFTGVESFSSTAIQAIVVLNQKLQSKGSRIVLCCLSPETRASFFPARQGNR